MTNSKVEDLISEIELRLSALKAELGVFAESKSAKAVQKIIRQSHGVVADDSIAKPTNFVLDIVNTIKSCDEADQIDSQILDKSSIPARVLLPFYICHKYFPEQTLTTGDVEKITSGLRVRVKTPNVSNAIAGSLHKYLEGDSTQAKGKVIRYKLNRKGAKYFESLLKPNEQA